MRKMSGKWRCFKIRKNYAKTNGNAMQCTFKFESIVSNLLIDDCLKFSEGNQIKSNWKVWRVCVWIKKFKSRARAAMIETFNYGLLPIVI